MRYAVFTRWFFPHVFVDPQYRLGAILGGYCLSSMTSINIYSRVDWKLDASEEISHADSGRHEPRLWTLICLAHEWTPMAEPTRKTLMSDNWPAPSPPRGRLQYAPDKCWRRKTTPGIPCWYVQVGRISEIAATKVDACGLRERSKPAYQVFSYTISPTHLHFLHASGQEDIVRLETLPRQPIPC